MLVHGRTSKNLVNFCNHAYGSYCTFLKLKGVQILDSGSAFRDKTLTIRFATLENLDIFGRNYPAAHLDEVMANLPFLDSRRKRVKSSRCGLNQVK